MSRNYKYLLEKIKQDETYQENIKWGKPRKGHPEGTVQAHIADLENLLKSVKIDLVDEEFDQLMILIHVHDTFKKYAKRGVAIEDTQSHASLAKAFLSKFTSEKFLLDIVQYHDEGYALYRHFINSQKFNIVRLQTLVEKLDSQTTDFDDPLELFLIFSAIDGSSDGKSQDPVRWLFKEVKKINSTVQIDDQWLPIQKPNLPVKSQNLN